MTENIDKLRSMMAERYTLRSAVACHAVQQDDPIEFFDNLDRFPEGDDILSLLADATECKTFFDVHYNDIEATLTDMRTEGQFPDFMPDGDLRCWLAESAFLYTARQIAREIGIDDEA